MISLQILVLSQHLEYIPNLKHQVLSFQILSLKVGNKIIEDFNERNHEVS